MKRILKNLARLRPLFSRGEKRQYLFLLLLMFAGAFLDVLGIGAIPAFVALLADQERLMDYPYVADVLNRLGLSPGNELVMWGAGVLIVLYFAKNAFLAWLYHYQFRLVEQQRVNLASRIFHAYLQAPYTFITQRNSAELLRNTNGETQAIVNGVLLPVLSGIMGAVMTLSILVLLIIATPWLSLFGVGIIAIGGGIYTRFIRKRLQRYGQVAVQERKNTLKSIQQGLGALPEARVSGRLGFFERVFHRSLSRYARVRRLKQFIQKVSPYMLETIAVTGMLAVTIGMLMSGADAALLLPVLALFGAATVRLKSTVAQIFQGWSSLQYSMPSIDVVVTDLNYLEPILEQQKRRARKMKDTTLTFRREIRFENVTFTYPGADKPALDNISLTIPRGSSVAFVGATGSGKSTLISLLLGLLEPQQGRVVVDGVNIFDKQRQWLDHVGYIPQSIYLTDDTVTRNIALGLPDKAIDMERIQMAVRAAQLKWYIDQLPDGLENMVGDRGVRMSGGQRQRVGLARALYHNPDVLVMDEATSALDNNTENLVMEALQNLKAERTFIMIAHRLSTVKKCDQLYFLEHGRIAARGSYEDLADGSAAFRQMAEMAE